MSGKLQDYQVLDVLCGGTFYKVRHKVTNDIFAWKAYDCTAYSNEQLRSVALDADTINKVRSGASALLRVHDTVLHAPSRTLYFVLEHGAWRSVAELIETCETADKCASEAFVWHLLLELARACRALRGARLAVLRPRLAPDTVLVEEGGAVRLQGCEPPPAGPPAAPALRQLGGLLAALCAAARGDKHSQYSDDLLHVIGFLADERNANLHPDVILYHPTVLANIETFSRPKHLSEILVSADYSNFASVNKCDSEKAEDLCRTVRPAPRSSKAQESPVYCNITPKKFCNKEIQESNSPQGQLSPTIAALALELPGFVPRSRKAITGALETYGTAQQVSENTLSQQWMSRLIALRQREQSLNQRERELISKEISNSPAAKVIPLNGCDDIEFRGSDGITLPPVFPQADERQRWASRRHKRTSSVRLKNRRKTFAYEDLDSSLSADNGDGSLIITAAKFTKDNMPRNLFPEPSKKVHFTPVNPFVESDESVTLTFYELENVDKEGYQVPRCEERAVRDISKFKYLDLEKLPSEKRAALPWSHSSPSKQAKISQNIFSDVTNTKGNLRKTPSKTSITSKGSNMSRFSIATIRSHWSEDSSSKLSDGSVAERTRASIRQSLAQTPVAPDAKKKSRKSLLPFKTPFKFMGSTKI